MGIAPVATARQARQGARAAAYASRVAVAASSAAAPFQ